MSDPVTYVSYQLETREMIARGRMAWCLAELVAAGPKGITTLENPAPRISEYVRRLRNDGLDIETVNEYHPPPFKGRHGRYVLRSAVDVIEMKTASAESAEVANG
jgi:hypothetical protein